ncbi:cytochrome P450 [Pseudonocardia sp. ICBG601]|uniref:cytochrome P450 n=1 Tax=Pseudonocardia sp. ICBG601 TaxID=2846759 RepID=UPI001CF71838|nr:cytochrome P450 [Pseudonocardia sp. ICBG601]
MAGTLCGAVAPRQRHRRAPEVREPCSVVVARVALEPILIDGLEIGKGETVLPIIGGANRDPRVFESPGELDLRRVNAGRQISFGFGPHFCLGKQLAMLEARIVFHKLATRFPDMEADTEAARFGGSLGLRSLLSMQRSPGY